MANTYFEFQKFKVHHDRCAMKVGTDGVLIGAWAHAENQGSILDVGTGTGVIALMMAQRFRHTNITAIDIDADAVSQATENVASSMFSDRINVKLEDIRQFQPSEKFDCIVCNPPFFTENILPLNAARNIARNTSSLSFESLIRNVTRILSPSGLFNIIVPTKSEEDIESLCLIFGLHLMRKCRVKTTTSKPAKRTMFTFSFSNECKKSNESLVIQKCTGIYSEEYIRLTQDFYLLQTFATH